MNPRPKNVKGTAPLSSRHESHAARPQRRTPRTWPTLAAGVIPTPEEIEAAKAIAREELLGGGRQCYGDLSNAKVLAHAISEELHTYLPVVIGRRRAHLAAAARQAKGQKQSA